MIKQQYDFPEKAKFGRMVAKSRIYQHTSPTTKLKDLFTQQVGKIIWSYKLSPETINLPTKDKVDEIQVFTILLKKDTLNKQVLRLIDKAIPSPIIFELSYDNKCRYVAAYKRPSDADKNKWVISDYIESDWLDDGEQTINLPISLDLKSLYYSFLLNLMPIQARENETMADTFSRVEQLHSKQREANTTQAKMNKEKQFNRKIELNSVYKALMQDIKQLTD